MRKEFIVIESDISGREGASRMYFGLDGAAYEIDLTPEEAAGLRASLAPWITAGRKVDLGSKPGRPAVAKKPKPQFRAAEVREWARSHGIEMPERGRIPKDVLAAFEGRVPVGDVAPRAAEPSISRTPTVPLAPQFRGAL